ncbi:hypothetical protein [Paracoccus aminophilus]|uniref:Chaperone modulatory protein CbpM n=1 Tax=Paracoccus aminophilus JCM 7686 TaxID=1367847 RepID=S5XWS1_PARAH|nr:hypothetical protein [Paracoccus aminophilus]AGT09752.1 hypothetical protein JCM7686_2696 [Paracoccus aminophilus JCM 7686]
MSRHYTVRETLVAVPDLSSGQLDRYIRVGVVRPISSAEGPVFREIDIARLSLLVDLTEGFALDDEALGLVMSLLDQLHGARADMRAMLDAVAQEPAETRARLSRAIHEIRVVVRR